MTRVKWLSVMFLTVCLTGCGEDFPTITHFKFIDDEFTTTIDTNNADELAELSAMFFDRQEVSDLVEALDFKYLIEISRDSKEERWRCTKTGYCRLYVQGDSPIYKLERHVELYQKATK